MQANDTALDYVDDYRRYDCRKECFLLNKAGKDVVAGKRPLEKDLRGIKEDKGILGVAEFFLDKGVDVSRCRQQILDAIGREVKGVKNWVNPAKRKRALLLFKACVMGKKVARSLLEADNEGLLSKISKVFGSKRT